MTFIIAFILIITFFVCQLTIRHMAKPLNLLADTADEESSSLTVSSRSV
jgi:Co/Zn/Cd efflux system component